MGQQRSRSRFRAGWRLWLSLEERSLDRWHLQQEARKVQRDGSTRYTTRSLQSKLHAVRWRRVRHFPKLYLTTRILVSTFQDAVHRRSLLRSTTRRRNDSYRVDSTQGHSLTPTNVLGRKQRAEIPTIAGCADRGAQSEEGPGLVRCVWISCFVSSQGCGSRREESGGGSRCSSGR